MKFRKCCGRRTNLPHASTCPTHATEKLVKDARAFLDHYKNMPAHPAKRDVLDAIRAAIPFDAFHTYPVRVCNPLGDRRYASLACGTTVLKKSTSNRK